jgi:hypothetical protein
MLNKTFTRNCKEAPTKAGGPIWFGLVQFGTLEPAFAQWRTEAR